MPYKVISVILAVYVFLNLIMPKITGGLTIYFLTIICWLTVALLTLKISTKEENVSLFGWRLSKPLILNAAMIGILQTVVFVFAGLFTAFGRSPYAFTPIAITVNIAYFSSALIGIELSRAYLVKSCTKRKIIMGIALIALFYTFISFPLTRFLTLGAPADTAKFIGSDLLPALAQSLLATYLALVGGPTASIAYLGTLQAFEWLSPILPNPTWTIKALITTLTPTIGFLTINQTVSPFKLMRLGIISRSEVTGRRRETKKSSPLSWTAIAVIALVLVWGSTGLLGFQPSIIASGSMTPTLEVGDIAITVQTRQEAIKVGDIIQYWRQGEPAPTIHRVLEIYKSGGTTYFVTKGDANNAPDDPITPIQTVGKVIFVISKLGWVSIHIKNIIGTIWSILSANTTLAYATLTITTLTASIYAIHAHKSRHRHWRRKGGWQKR